MCQPSILKWIFDCGATDTMTNDLVDLIKITLTPCSKIQTANGECVDITKVVIVEISSSIHLRNCLLIPSLTYKLLSVSQLTKELDCTILVKSDGLLCRMLGPGRSLGVVLREEAYTMLMRRLKMVKLCLLAGLLINQLWMWHCRLGHPSLAYLKHLFPSLKNVVLSLDCETCVLTKSHKHSYFPCINHSARPFSLIHSDV